MVERMSSRQVAQARDPVVEVSGISGARAGPGYECLAETIR
jgi:hypothetical protein